jgi:nucleotide-binding universal stress UspA family protein
VGPAGTTLPHEEALDEVRATARRAADLGVKTELLRVRTRHAATALLEVVHERDAGLVVLGPDLGRVSRLRFRPVARKLRREADCLVWVAPDG